MAYALPTVSEFKSQFSRDFPYAVPAWGALASATIAAGVITAITVSAGGRGYADAPTFSVIDAAGPGAGAVLVATVLKGKVTGIAVTGGGAGYVSPQIVIAGGSGDETNLELVTDEDIAGASVDANFNINRDLFDDEPQFQRAFCYLQAHCLVEKISAATQGLGSQYNWVTQSKNVGNVSAAYSIPKDILDNPMLAAFSRTQYGALYLQIIMPLLVGNFSSSFRLSLP